MVLTASTITGMRSELNTFVVDNFTYFATGTGTAPASTSDTALGGETFQTAIQQTTNLTTSIIVSGYQNANQNNDKNITEVGFKTGSGGTLRQRAVLLSSIAKTSAKEVWIDLEIKNTFTQVTS